MRFLPLLRTTCLCGGIALAGAADTAWPELQDPLGLGPRLVTIAWLQEHGHALPPGADDATVLAAYAQATRDDAAIVARAEVDRLRYLLRSRHKIDPPAEADRAALAKLLADAEAAQRETELADSKNASGRVTVAPPSDPHLDASLPVPWRYQIPFTDLVWKVGVKSSGIPLWKKGGDGIELPRAAGAITSRWVTWNGKDYRITAFEERSPDPKGSFAITTDVGTFQAVRLTESSWEVLFTDNAGSPLTFRTCAAETLVMIKSEKDEPRRSGGMAP